MDQIDAAGWVWMILIVALSVQALPFLTAVCRDHWRPGSILLVSLIPVFGWVVAMVWALGDPRSPQEREEAMAQRYADMLHAREEDHHQGLTRLARRN